MHFSPCQIIIFLLKKDMKHLQHKTSTAIPVTCDVDETYSNTHGEYIVIGSYMYI